MTRNILKLCLTILIATDSICAQTQIDKNGVVQVPDEVIAANKLLHDRLAKPDFITLRLTYGYAYDQPVETPQPYTVGDSMYFELLVSQSLFDNIMIEYSQWSYYEYRPELRKDGETIAYTEQAQKAVERADKEPPFSSVSIIKLLSSKEKNISSVGTGPGITIPAHSKSALANLNLKEWYGNLAPGRYKLTNRHRFEIDGPWAPDSLELLFEIVR